MSFENINVQEIPSADIAMWVVKIGCAKFALKEQIFVTGEDGQCAYTLADPAPELVEHWTNVANRKEAYEAVTIYELAHGLSLAGLNRALHITEAEAIDPLLPPKGPVTHQEQHFNAKQIGDQALLVGLGRLGIIEADGDQALTVSDSVVAAFMYKRASIRQRSDRQLYERAEEIDDLTRRIAKTVQPRTMQLSFSDKTTSEMTVYRGMAYDRSNTASSVYDMWWTELDSDFRRIEQAASVTV